MSRGLVLDLRVLATSPGHVTVDDPVATLGNIEKGGVGFERGPKAGHKYWRRVRGIVGGKLVWVYYYNTPADRAKYAADRERKRKRDNARAALGRATKRAEAEADRRFGPAPVAGAPSSTGAVAGGAHAPGAPHTPAPEGDNHGADIAKLRSEFLGDHPELRSKRAAWEELNEEYVQGLFGMQAPPAVRGSDAVKAMFGAAIAAEYGDGGEPEDLHGEKMHWLRAVEMAAKLVPAHIFKACDGQMKELDFKLGSEDDYLSQAGNERVLGYAERRSGRICLGADRIRLGGGEKTRALFGGLTPVHVLVHEMSHQIHNRMMKDADQPLTPGGISWNQWLDFYGSTLKKGLPASVREAGITPYAETNEFEAWAESFSASLMYPHTMAHQCPQTYDMMRRFFGSEYLRPRVTDDDEVRRLREAVASAPSGEDKDKLLRQLDMAEGLDRMSPTDERLEWWKGRPPSPVEKLVRAAREEAPNYHETSLTFADPPDEDAVGKQGDYDRFYEMNCGARTVYLRVGPDGGNGGSDWDPISSETSAANVVLRPEQVKECYDENGRPLDRQMVYWHLHQDLYHDATEVIGEATIGEGKAAKKVKVTVADLFEHGLSRGGSAGRAEGSDIEQAVKKVVEANGIEKWMRTLTAESYRVETGDGGFGWRPATGGRGGGTASLETYDKWKAYQDRNGLPNDQKTFDRERELYLSQRKMAPQEIDHHTYRQRSGTFNYDRIGLAGQREMDQLANLGAGKTERLADGTVVLSREQEGTRRELLERLREVQPGVELRQTRGKGGKFEAPRIVVDEEGKPRFTRKRWVNTNPDGTQTVFFTQRGADGNHYLEDPMWSAILTPNGEAVRSATHLEKLCRDAAAEKRRTWISVKTDRPRIEKNGKWIVAEAGDIAHYYHLEVEFDGHGQPRILGTEWARRLGVDTPRVDQLLEDDKVIGKFRGDARPILPAEQIKLAPEKSRSGTPQRGDRVILSVRGEELPGKAAQDKEVVAWLTRVIPGKDAGVVPDPPGWDRMPDGVPELKNRPGEVAQRLVSFKRGGVNISEKDLRTRGLLPPWYVGSVAQREWLETHYLPAYVKWNETKDAETAKEYPTQYIFAGETGGGAGRRTFRRYGEAAVLADTRWPETTHVPKPLQTQVLAYMHKAVDPRTGATISKEARLVLPADGSLTPESVEGLPGVRVEWDDPKLKTRALAVQVRLDSFHNLRTALGGLSLTEEVNRALHDRIEMLRDAAKRKDDDTHVLETGQISPDWLVDNWGVGLQKTLPTGQAFIVADHQQRALQKMLDNDGRALLAHYMGCVSGSTVVSLNRAGKGFKATIAEVHERLTGGRYAWDLGILTYVRSATSETHTGLALLDQSWDSGRKTTYRLATVDGHVLRTTDEHKFWTPRGWAEHKDIQVGDLVAFEREIVAQPRKKQVYQIRTELVFHPNARGRGRAAMANYVSTHRLVVEAHMNGLDLEELVQRCRTSEDAVSGLRFLPESAVVHHIDEDIRNNDIGNLEVLDSQAKHAVGHGHPPGRFALDWTTVTECMADPFEEDTYDLTVSPMSPSYVANGLVVHNTGKTVSAIVGAKMMLSRPDPADPTKKHPDNPKRVLIVAPLNTVEQWRQAAGDFDDGAVVVGSGANDIPIDEFLKLSEAGKGDLVVCGPEYFTLHADKLKAAGFDGLVIDEVHLGVKNEEAERNRKVREWNADMKMMLLLTGTPMTTSPADMVEYIRLLSNGKQWADMTAERFTEEFLEPTSVVEDLGTGKKGPKIQVKAAKRGELAAILSQWMDIALPKDVRGKTLPAVRIEENQHAFMTGIQAQLYNLYMATAGSDIEAGALAEEERGRLSPEARRAVSAAKAVVNCPAFKPGSSEQEVMFEQEVPNKSGKMSKTKVQFRTFNPDELVGKGRGKASGKWPLAQELHPAELAIYNLMFQEVFGGKTYDEVAGTKITPEQLKAMKADGWPRTVPNPDRGPLGIRARGLARPWVDVMNERIDAAVTKGDNAEAERLTKQKDARMAAIDRALAFQRHVRRAVATWPAKDAKPFADMLADIAIDAGVDYDDAVAMMQVHPVPTVTETSVTVQANGKRVTIDSQETVTVGGVEYLRNAWVSDKKGSLHLLYAPQDWDEAKNAPRSRGGFENVRPGEVVTVTGKALKDAGIVAPKMPTGLSREQREDWERTYGDWEAPGLKYVGGDPDAKGRIPLVRLDTHETVYVDKAGISAQVASIFDPGKREERGRADLVMTIGNAKADELGAHIQRFHADSGPGRDGARQLVLFGNGILDSCRTMEAKLRTMGFRDANECIEGSPHFDKGDPDLGPNGQSPNGKYFVTYIGSTYTGDRELNVAIFQKVKDKLGRDSGTSLFVHKTCQPRTLATVVDRATGKPVAVNWAVYPGDTEPQAVRPSQWTPDQREAIKAQFGISAPESFVEVPQKDGSVQTLYFYGTPKSAKLLRDIALQPNPVKLGDEEAARVRATIAQLKADYEAEARKGASADPPLNAHQTTVFNNCEAIVCSDAAQVGMNLGNSVEMVMFDSLGSPMAEWQRITRCARMLPPAVEEDLIGKPVLEPLMVKKRDDQGNVVKEGGKAVLIEKKDDAGETIMVQAFDEHGRAKYDGSGPFSKLRDMEKELFSAGPREHVSGTIRSLGLSPDFPNAGRDMGTETFESAMGRIRLGALDKAQELRKTGAAGKALAGEWEAIAAKAAYAANLGTNATRAMFDEFAAMTTPGGTDRLISFPKGAIKYTDPEAGTYEGVRSMEPEAQLRAAIDTLPEAERTAILEAGFNQGAGGADSHDPVAVYMAIRAGEILDWIVAKRDEVGAEMRASEGGRVVTDADVTNRLIDMLPPEDRAILKSKKYLVNVRKLGGAAHVGQVLRNVFKDDEGKLVVEKVHTGYEQEQPVRTERGTRAMGRARMISFEQILTDVQKGVEYVPPEGFVDTTAAAYSNVSRTGIEKGFLFFDLGSAEMRGALA